MFSSLIAGMLLCNRRVEAASVVNMLSKFSCVGIEVEEDDIDFLSCCIEYDSSYSFYLREGFQYDTVLLDGMTVGDFLMDTAGEKVLSILHDNIKYQRKVLEEI